VVYFKDYYYYSAHNVSSINSINLEMIKLYPNPTKDIINLETSDNSISQCNVYNVNGQIVKSFKVFQGNNIYNISDFKTGIYFIQIPTQNGIVNKKIIKE